MATPAKLPNNTNGADSESNGNKALIMDKLEDIQSQIDNLNENASAEILEVEKRYNKLRKPLFDERSGLIANVPNFWQTVLARHPTFKSTFVGEDLQVLSYLKNLEVQEFTDIKSGYKITFTFDENPYFEDKVLTKEYIVKDNGRAIVKSTQIKWFPGKDITKTTVMSNAGDKREYMSQSFFCWFSDDSQSPTDEIGDLFKDELWVSPIPYYTGRFEDDEDDYDDDEDEDNPNDPDDDEADEDVEDQEDQDDEENN